MLVYYWTAFYTLFPQTNDLLIYKIQRVLVFVWLRPGKTGARIKYANIEGVLKIAIGTILHY